MFYQVRDLTGQRFGELTAIDHVGIDRTHHAMWLCECSCGAMKVIRSNNLLAREHPTISCGHVQREMARRLCGKLTKGKFGKDHPMFGWNPSVEKRQQMSAAHMKHFDLEGALHLREIGWSDRKIAKALRVGRTMMGRKLRSAVQAA